MVKKEHFYFNSRDHRTKIHAVRWIPEGEVSAVLQISHGMVEYIERYEEFAEFIAERGILVTGSDHLGHGESIRSEEQYGYFAEFYGNGILLKDLHRLKKITKELYPNPPYYILGHSMGSFLVRQYLCKYGQGINGAVIMGTGNQPKLLIQTGIFLTSMIAGFKGWEYRSRFIDSMAFGGYNKKFRPSRTERDWLTRDELLVDNYIADKRCQFMFTLNGYYNMFVSMLKLKDDDYLNKMPRKLPVYFVAGGQDPVGNFGAGVKKVAEKFQELGMVRVECKIYPEDRHEILNELDRELVYKDLFDWIQRQISE